METNKNTQSAAATATSGVVAKYENISEQVLSRIERFQADGGLTLPANYSVENHMKSAWLILQSTTDRNGNAALIFRREPRFLFFRPAGVAVFGL